MRRAGVQTAVLDKKRTVILLRSVVVISTSYLILFGPDAREPLSIAYILTLILTNLALLAVPAEAFHRESVSAALLLCDTACVLTGLYLTVGCFSQDFLIIYFFTIFLTAATQGLAQIALGAAVVSGLYGYWLWVSTSGSLGSGEWLRLPFFFIVAVFYAYMTEETKQERWRRQQAERESQHLRFLWHMADAASHQVTTERFVQGLAPLIREAFPRLHCTVADAAEPPADAARWFPVRVHGQTYCGLAVSPADGGVLRADEEEFCRAVALLAANALTVRGQVRGRPHQDNGRHQFLETLSHELRTPLHAILGYVEMLECGGPPPGLPTADDALRRLRANAHRMLSLVEELLTFAQLRAGDQRLAVGDVDLRQLFADLVSAKRLELVGRPVTVTWEVASDVGVIRSDHGKLEQILAHLLANAAKFTEAGSIHVCAQRAGGRRIDITVQDTGIGIDPADHRLIFEEFRQVDGSSTRRYDGMGLGLTLARELARLLGAEVEVESRRNDGATFRLRLPCEAAAGDAALTRDPYAPGAPVAAFAHTS